MPLKNHTNAWSYAVDNYTTEKLQEFVSDMREYVTTQIPFKDQQYNSSEKPQETLSETMEYATTTQIPLQDRINSLSDTDKWMYEIFCLMRDRNLLTCYPKTQDVELMKASIIEQYSLYLNTVLQKPNNNPNLALRAIDMYATDMYQSLGEYGLTTSVTAFLRDIRNGKIDLQSLINNYPGAVKYRIDVYNGWTKGYFNQEIMGDINNGTSPFEYQPNQTAVQHFQDFLDYADSRYFQEAWRILEKREFSIPTNLKKLIFPINYTDHAVRYNTSCGKSKEDILENRIKNLSEVHRWKFEIHTVIRENNLFEHADEYKKRFPLDDISRIGLIQSYIRDLLALQLNPQLNKIFQTPCKVGSIDGENENCNNKKVTSALREYSILTGSGDRLLGHRLLTAIRNGQIDLQSLLDNYPEVGEHILRVMTDQMTFPISQKNVSNTIINPFKYSPNNEPVKYFPTASLTRYRYFNIAWHQLNIEQFNPKVSIRPGRPAYYDLLPLNITYDTYLSIMQKDKSREDTTISSTIDNTSNITTPQFNIDQFNASLGANFENNTSMARIHNGTYEHASLRALPQPRPENLISSINVVVGSVIGSIALLGLFALPYIHKRVMSYRQRITSGEPANDRELQPLNSSSIPPSDPPNGTVTDTILKQLHQNSSQVA